MDARKDVVGPLVGRLSEIGNGAARPLKDYLSKMKGGRRAIPPLLLSKATLAESFWSWLGAVVGIGACAYLTAQFLEDTATTLIVGSFGASAVLVYGTIQSPLAQPRNLLGGHLLSALVGVAVYQAVDITWMAAALAVSLALVVMILSNTVHPPGGATALIAVIGGEQVHSLGFLYVVIPIGLGVLILLLVALLVNNLSRERQYPSYWI